MAGPASLREKHTAQTRQRLLDEATALFIEQGFEATTIQEIAERADVSPRTYFRYFPTKEALLFHDLEERLNKIREWIEHRPPDESPAQTLISVLCATFDEIESTPEQRALTVRLLSERPSFRSYQRTTIIEHTEQQVTATLARRAGLAVDDRGLRALVAAISACFDVALRDWIEHGTEGTFDTIFLDTIASLGAALPPTPHRRPQAATLS